MGEAEHCACERWGDNSHELQREKVFAFMGGGHWWCKKFPTVLVFQKTVCLNRVLATSEDIPGLVCLVLFEVSSCSTLPGLCSTRYSLQRPGVILTNWVLGGEGLLKGG